MALIEVHNNTKIYQTGSEKLYANKDISFSIEKGELVIILGASGAGKSTLLNILGGMDTNSSGEVIVAGHDIAKYDRRELTTYRRLSMVQRSLSLRITRLWLRLAIRCCIFTTVSWSSRNAISIRLTFSQLNGR